MIYPIPNTSLKRKKKKRSKAPWIISIIFLIVVLIGVFLFFSYRNYYSSTEMVDKTVDFLFFFKERKEVIFIRTNLEDKINYVVKFPSISYEPILGISLDYDSPGKIYSSVEKLFGISDRSFYCSIDSKYISDEILEDITSVFIDFLKNYPVSSFEFIFGTNLRKLGDNLIEGNMNQKAIFRLLTQIKGYAVKIISLSFMTKKPVKITKIDNKERHEVERLYIDEKSLKIIREFMSE